MFWNGYYYKNPWQMQNLKEFDQLVRDMDLQLSWPNKELAPWHVQIRVGQHGIHPQTVNAWPHLLKTYWSGHRGPRVGAAAMYETILEATDAAYEDVSLFEEGHDAAPLS